MGEATSPWKERLRAVLRNPWTERSIKYVVVPVLLLCSLWLPPVSLGVRLFHIDLPQITAQGGAVSGPGGGRLMVAAGALSGQMRVRLRAVDLSDKQAGVGEPAKAIQAVPANLQLVSPLYFVDAYGSRPKEATFSAPLTGGLQSTDQLDVYAWDGKAWRWVPSRPQADGAEVEASLTSLPRALAVVQAQPQALAVGVGAPDVAAVNASPLDIASELYLGGLSLAEGGAVNGEITLSSAPADLVVLPVLSNQVDGVARADWVANILNDAQARANHVKAIVEAVNRGGYKGLSLEYAGLDQALRDSFAAFVDQLGAELHKGGKTLAVRVDEPRLNPDGSWDTTGYAWAALGRAADILRIPAVAEPSAYAAGGAMEACLRELTRQVDRQKVQLVINANATEKAGDARRSLVYGDALSLASQAPVAAGGNVVLPGARLAVQLPQMGSGLKEDAASGYTYFVFKDSAGVEHTVVVENATSVARKLALAQQFAIGGVAIDNLAGTANDAHIWETVRVARTPSGRGGDASAQRAAARYAIAWRVESKDGKVVDQGTAPADSPELSWTAAKDPGEYTITLAISEDGGKTTLGTPAKLAVNIPTPTPSPTPKPTATPTPKPAAPEAPAVPAAPAPSGGGSFGYGIQVDMITDGNHARVLDSVQALGFGWIKQQVEWFRYNPAPGVYDWGALDSIANDASARGIKVLFSVCKAPNWARPADDDKSVAGPPADPGTYAEFMKQMAAHFRGRVQAYEIWNEQNLWYEWGGRGHRLSAAKYVELLRAAYGAIKSVDPGAIVISGAPTPTGFNDGDTAIDDQQYLRQMYDAGLKYVCDAVGAHPSGYNNPPDADWRTFRDPSNSFQAVGHPSWFFRGTMEGYRNIMIAYGDGYKRIWPTEFGWASVDGLGVRPAAGYEYAADNTVAEQAQYIVRAYEMGRNWGFVGTMFLWNLNFAPICGPADEKAAFSIVDPGWGRRPAFNALAGMPK